MFLYQLNLPEKMAFLQLAKELVIVDDGQIDDDEMEMLIMMSNEMQISVNDVFSIEFSLERLAKQFIDKRSQKICITELIILAFANHHYHPEQNVLILALMDTFNMEKENIIEIEVWVEKLSKIYQDGQIIIDTL